MSIKIRPGSKQLGVKGKEGNQGGKDFCSLLAPKTPNEGKVQKGGKRIIEREKGDLIDQVRSGARYKPRKGGVQGKKGGKRLTKPKGYGHIDAGHEPWEERTLRRRENGKEGGEDLLLSHAVWVSRKEVLLYHRVREEDVCRDVPVRKVGSR